MQVKIAIALLGLITTMTIVQGEDLEEDLQQLGDHICKKLGLVKETMVEPLVNSTVEVMEETLPPILHPFVLETARAVESTLSKISEQECCGKLLAAIAKKLGNLSCTM